MYLKPPLTGDLQRRVKFTNVYKRISLKSCPYEVVLEDFTRDKSSFFDFSKKVAVRCEIMFLLGSFGGLMARLSARDLQPGLQPKYLIMADLLSEIIIFFSMVSKKIKFMRRAIFIFKKHSLSWTFFSLKSDH